VSMTDKALLPKGWPGEKKGPPRKKEGTLEKKFLMRHVVG